MLFDLLFLILFLFYFLYFNETIDFTTNTSVF